MKKSIWSLISILLVAILALSACAPAASTEVAEKTEVAEPTEAMTEEATEEATEAATEEATEEATEAATEEVTEAAGSDLSGTVTLWHSWKENEIESLNEVIAAFQAANPNVTFDVLYVPFDDLRGKFETAAATGGGPTVLIGAADWGPAMYDAALVSDLTGLVSEDVVGTINEAALGAVQYDGALIGLPQTLKGVVMFRNKALIPDASASWDALVEAATAANQGDTVGLDFEAGFFFSAGHLAACGGELMTAEGDPAFNNEAGVCWLNTLKSVKDAGFPVEYYNDNDVNLFKAGQAGIIIDGNWNTSALAEAIGADNLAIDPWPTTEGGALSGYVQTENIYLSANAVEDDAAASAAFIEFFLSPEAQALLADPTKAGHIPAVSGVEVTDRLQQEAVAAFAGGVAFPVIPEMGAYWGPMDTALQSVLNDGADPAAALAQAEADISAAIEEIRGGG